MSSHTEIAIVGAGLGGLAAAALCQRAQMHVTVYEQTSEFARLGAGIHLGPNVMKVMRAIGLEAELERLGCHPDHWFSRDWRTGAYDARVEVGNARERYGAVYVTVHRADLHGLLASAVESGSVVFGKQLIDVDDRGTDVELRFADDSTRVADLVIGADGVDSRVRETLLGPEPPAYSGWVAHRALIPAQRLADLHLERCTKWWSHDRHLVAYYVNRAQSLFYYVTGAPEREWTHGTSWVPSSRDEMAECFTGFHPIVQGLIAATDGVTKWPLLEREPLPLWSRGRLVLLGDACHPMKPHMGQGAAMAIEDAAVLVRCLAVTGLDDYASAFELYEDSRKDRASRVQAVSNANTWLRYDEDPSWVFAYDALHEPLGRSSGLAER